jgi:hypothetical protein
MLKYNILQYGAPLCRRLLYEIRSEEARHSERGQSVAHTYESLLVVDSRVMKPRTETNVSKNRRHFLLSPQTKPQIF